MVSAFFGFSPALVLARIEGPAVREESVARGGSAASGGSVAIGGSVASGGLAVVGE